MKFLDKKTFEVVIDSAPLFSIDLVCLNNKNQVLFGKRINRPAKDFWFTPGGRVYKNESLADAFKRISLSELGKTLEIQNAKPLGLFEHFYEDSVFSNDISTHYLNVPYLVEFKTELNQSLPNEQHSCYKWVDLDSVKRDDSIHKFGKIYLDSLQSVTSQKKSTFYSVYSSGITEY